MCTLDVYYMGFNATNPERNCRVADGISVIRSLGPPFNPNDLFGFNRSRQLQQAIANRLCPAIWATVVAVTQYS